MELPTSYCTAATTSTADMSPIDEALKAMQVLGDKMKRWRKETTEKCEKINCLECGWRVKFVSWPQDGFVLCWHLIEVLRRLTKMNLQTDAILLPALPLAGLPIWSKEKYAQLSACYVDQGIA